MSEEWVSIIWLFLHNFVVDIYEPLLYTLKTGSIIYKYSYLYFVSIFEITLKSLKQLHLIIEWYCITPVSSCISIMIFICSQFT